MSTEWTTNRLEALHEGTTVAIWDGGSVFTKDTAGDPDRPWAFSRGGRESSAGLIRESQHPDTGQGWIRVVSVPVDALLIPDAVLDAAGRDYWINGRPYSVSAPLVASVIRAAIGYVTGDPD